MKTLPVTAPAYRTLGTAVTRIFDTDFNPALPLVYALGLLTGLPYYPATVPVIVTACEAGIGIWDINGYWVGGYAPVLRPNAGTPEKTLGAITYGAAVGLLVALPSRLTYSALTAIGFDFDYGTNPASPAPLPVAAPGIALGVAPLGETFTASPAGSPATGPRTFYHTALGVAGLAASRYVAAYAPATGYAPNAEASR